MKKQKYNKIDLTGRKFKYLTVLSLAPKHKFSNSKVDRWICGCDCGKKKIINGKLSKWMNDSCLSTQPFIKDDSITIQQLINDVSGTVGEKIELKKFVRFSA